MQKKGISTDQKGGSPVKKGMKGDTGTGTMPLEKKRE